MSSNHRVKSVLNFLVPVISAKARNWYPVDFMWAKLWLRLLVNFAVHRDLYLHMQNATRDIELINSTHVKWM